MYQCDILLFQNKNLYLAFACADSYMKVLFHSFQKSFQSLGRDQLVSGQENMVLFAS